MFDGLSDFNNVKTESCIYGNSRFLLWQCKKAVVNTTPDVDVLYNMLLEAKEHGVKYFVMEVSSHALDKERIYGLEFDEVAFSNLTQDHLDYHKTIENYANAKENYLQKQEITKLQLLMEMILIINTLCYWKIIILLLVIEMVI